MTWRVYWSRVVLVVLTFGLVITVGYFVSTKYNGEQRFDRFEKECQQKGGQAVWTGNQYRNQVLCLNKKYFINIEVE